MLSTSPTVTPSYKARADFVPASFEEMYAHYFPYVVRLVGKFGIDYQNAEDVAQIILTKFFEKDALSDFDADYQTAQENARKALFRTFLSGFVKAYVRHYTERQRITKQREGISTDAIVLFGFADGPMTWLELNETGYVDEHEELEHSDLIAAIRARLAALPVRGQQGCSLADFFEAVLKQIEGDRKLDTGVLAVEFGVTKTSIHNWLRKLRTEIHLAIEER